MDRRPFAVGHGHSFRGQPRPGGCGRLPWLVSRDLQSWPAAVTSHWPAPVAGANRRGKLLWTAAAATRSGHPLRLAGHLPRPDTVASFLGHQLWPSFAIRLGHPPWPSALASVSSIGHALWPATLAAGAAAAGAVATVSAPGAAAERWLLRRRSLGGSCQSSGSCDDTTWPLRFDLCWLAPAWVHGT